MCVDEWIDGWMDRWMEGLLEGGMDGWVGRSETLCTHRLYIDTFTFTHTHTCISIYIYIYTHIFRQLPQFLPSEVKTMAILISQSQHEEVAGPSASGRDVLRSAWEISHLLGRQVLHRSA